MPYVARKPVTVLGVRYAPGTPVPVDAAPRNVAQKLIEQRRVVLVEADKVTVQRDAPTSAARKDGETDVEVVHRGARWFDVLVGGQVVNEKGLSREDADALAASYGPAPA